MNKVLKLGAVVALIIAATSIVITTKVDAATILENSKPNMISSIESSEIKTGGLIPETKIASNSVSKVEGAGSLSKAEDYMNSKLGDVVGLLQSFIKPFTYITFILSAISIVIGIISGSKHKFAGILGMAFSILVYMCVSYGPEIVEYFAAWLSI